MRVLVLGAYGLIGAEIVRALQAEKHHIIGLVRSREKASRLLPDVECVSRDLAQLCTPEDWRDLIGEVDAVVNAAGALQDGLKDNVALVQDKAIRALIEACERQSQDICFVQISAPGAEEGATTEFMRSKARADAALRASALSWVIFKPGLVIARAAYGGTALIRALAGVPFFQPIIMGNASIQIVSATEVGSAVAIALSGAAPLQFDYDLVSGERYTLSEIVAQLRQWLGFSPAHIQLAAPVKAGFALAKLADLAGYFGWRSPLRTTALKVLQKDVRGDPAPWRKAIGAPLMSLEETLAAMPATAQERIYARVQLALPFAVISLGAFFIASGIVGLAQLDLASTLIANKLGEAGARSSVIAGSLLDIALGAAIFFRPWSRLAALGMVLLSLSYLVLGTILTGSLWGDPLGPFMKIIPVIVLAFVVALILEER